MDCRQPAEGRRKQARQKPQTNSSSKRLSTPSHLLAALLLFSRSVLAGLPYDPIRVFHPLRNNSGYVYVLEPSSGAANHGRLSAIKTTSTLKANSLSSTTISDSLPFLAGDASASWSAVLDTDDTIVVYSGDCSSGAAGASLWRFTPRGTQGTWSKQSFDTINVTPGQALTGANFLASGVTFSANQTEQDSNMYFFGGMCPSSGSSASTWTADAAYSAQMLLFERDVSTNYDFVLIPGQGQPIPEAGFSLTPLQPSYSQTSGGSTSKQQDILLLGGHTQTAFINMTRVALFSLPATTWSFVNINPPNDKTDLKPKREPATLEPRSGHTAILTEDGTQVVVFGGWVGDVNTAADPQLAILDLGLGYGGTGAWSWTIPSVASLPFSQGAGIYGHGAVMLPGNVMMVTGGYDIHSSGGSKQRRALQTPSTQNFFFNVTSSKWIPSYNPRLASKPAKSHSGSSGLNSSQKTGLGVGIALGLLALILALVIGYAYSRRLKREREERGREIREKELNEFSDVLQGMPYEAMPYADGRDPSIDGRGGSMYASSVWDRGTKEMEEMYPWSANPLESNGGWKRNRGHEAERTGLDLNIPSPNRGLRRSAYGRAYQMAPRFEDGRLGRSNMHAIQEMDEDQSSASSSRKPSQAHRSLAAAGKEALDPFRDPSPADPGEGPSKVLTIKRKPVGSSEPDPVSPAEERQREMSGWIKDWSAAQAILHGRSSPDKSDRTSSNLSDGSTRSGISSRSRSTAAGTGTAAPSRATSARSVRYLPSLLPAILHPFFSNAISPTRETPPDGRSHSSNSRPGTSHKTDGESFTTAKSTASHLQAESETLLGRSNTTYPNLGGDDEPDFARESSPLRPQAGSIGRLGGWVGSVKRAMPRVLSTTGRSSSMTATVLRPGGIGADGFPEYTIDQRSSSSSPTKGRRPVTTFIPEGGEGSGAMVRRSVSDGANFWASKRGAQDWEADPASATLAPRDLAAATSGGKEGAGFLTPLHTQSASMAGTPTADGFDGEDWDVEAAVEERCVQLMFTVPRERLRVVNADIDALSTSDAGDAGVERRAEAEEEESHDTLVVATTEAELV